MHQRGGGETPNALPGPSGITKRKLPSESAANVSKQLRLAIANDNQHPQWAFHTAPPTNDTITDNSAEIANNNDVNHFYELRSVKKTFNKKFNLQCDDYQARFKNMTDIDPSQFPIRVHQIMDSIFNDVLSVTGNDSRIRVCMDADGLNRPYNGPFMEASVFDHERIIVDLCKILNSNEKILLEGGEVRINIIRADMPPKGSGKTHKHMNNRTTMELSEWASRKQSLVTIINNDELCMARALVVGIAAIRKTKNPTDENIKLYKQITNSKNTLQKSLAEKLHTDANVLQGPCGVDEARKFQDFLSDYQVLIYAAHVGNRRIYTGPHKKGKYHDFNVFTSCFKI